jgi:hypothetical protein
MLTKNPNIDCWFQDTLGDKYCFKGVAIHSKTEEPLVICHRATSFQTLYAIPYDFFFSDIELSPGIYVPRFYKLGKLTDHRPGSDFKC